MKSQFPAALAAIAFVAGAQPLSAQTTPEGDGLSDSAYGLALDPITIFATLSPIAAFDYPGQVSVIDAEEIETEQAGSIGEILESVPGVFIDGGARRSGEAPTIRGFREEDILILVDGVRQSFISGHDGRIFIEPDLLKSVEVVKGPISSLYGSGAIGGVIALTTVDAADFLEPGETRGVSLKAGYQSVNDEIVLTSTGFARTEDGKFDVIASFTYRDAGDIELGSGATLLEDEQIKSSLVKGTAQLSSDLKFTGSWIHYQNDALNPNNPQSDTLIDAENPLVNRFTQSDTVSGKLSYAPAGNPWIDGNLLVYWAQHSNEEDDFDPASNRLTERKIETTGVNIDNRSRFDLIDWGRLTLTYGAEYYVDQQTGTDSAPPFGGTISNVPDADASYYGTFLQAEFDITEPGGMPGELKIIPGVRWDGFENNYNDDLDYEDYKEQAISPKLGVSYKPVPWLMVFGNYGSAFRAPSYTELYAQGVHFPIVDQNVFIPNPDLKPQEATTFEAGLGFEFKEIATHGDRLTIKGSYWHTDAENFIDLNVVGAEVDTSGPFPVFGGCFSPTFPPAPLDCYSQFVNVEKAELEGVEIVAKYDAVRWYTGLGFTHIDGRDKTTGEYLGSLHPDKFVLDAGVKVPEIWSRFGTRVTFADEFTKFNVSESGTPEGPRDGYTTLDLYAVIEPEDGLLKGFRLDLGVDNLTDEAYEVIAKGVYEEGRNYKAAVRWTQKW